MKTEITTLINTWEDVISITSPSQETLNLINYEGNEESLIFARDFIKLSLIAKAYNQGWMPKKGELRWFPYFWVSSGFVFSVSYFDNAGASVASAARLCFKNEACAKDAGQKFTVLYKQAIITGMI